MKKITVFLVMIVMIFVGSNSFAQNINANGTGTANSTSNPTVNIDFGDNPVDPVMSSAALKASENPNAYRGFNIVGNAPNLPLISHFGPRSNSGAFKTIPELLTYTWLFSEGALEAMAEDEGKFTPSNDYQGFPKAGKMKDDQRWIAIVLQKRFIEERDGKKIPGVPVPFTFKDRDGQMKQAAMRGY